MKVLLILAFGCLTVSTYILDEDNTRINGENGWYVPYENGTFYWLEKEKIETNIEFLGIKEIIFWPLTSVKFYLYTKSNPTNGQKIESNINSLNRSNFNPNYPTRLIIHGAWQSQSSNSIKKLRDTFFTIDEYNVIIADWAIARTPSYIYATLAIPKIGKTIANFMRFLVTTHSMPLQLLHVIGFGLGAHVAGYAGKEFTSVKINTIIGLDPSLPLFSFNESGKRLNSTDALYVETIQTDSGILGYRKPIGKAAFYPNGGSNQPGCYTSICNHKRAIDYYAESIVRDDFAAIKCKSYQDALDKNCGKNFSSIRMGGDKITSLISGAFMVPVNKKPPYGVLVWD